MRLPGKIAMITGAASGFGRATAVRFAKEGASVVIADLHPGRAKETADLVQAAGGTAEVVIGDIATAVGAKRMVEVALSRFSRVDVLVNNAGISGGILMDTWNVDETGWDEIHRVNLKSVYLCSRATIPTMLAQGGGAIVNLASIAASSPVGGAAYAATKGAILSYTIVVARELARRNVRMNCVSPGYMRTPMSTGEHRGATPEEQEARMAGFAKRAPMGRAGTVDDIANAILYLASDEACYVTGQEVVVDGGFLVR